VVGLEPGAQPEQEGQVPQVPAVREPPQQPVRAQQHRAEPTLPQRVAAEPARLTQVRLEG
jgi:hypothetical protein